MAALRRRGATFYRIDPPLAHQVNAQVMFGTGHLGLSRGLPLIALLAACTSASERGTSVEFVSTAMTLATEPRLRVGENGQLRVDTLYWTNVELELEPCTSPLSRVVDWLVPRAHAHGVSTPTLMATPSVESAAASGDIQLGELGPPATEYCGLRYGIGPADMDATGLLEHPEMLGKAFLLRGALGYDGEALVDFELSSPGGFEVTLPISLDLTRAHPRATIRLIRDAAATLEGLSLEGLTPNERYQALVEALLTDVRVAVE
jgi:hypothetical protein